MLVGFLVLNMQINRHIKILLSFSDTHVWYPRTNLSLRQHASLCDPEMSVKPTYPPLRYITLTRLGDNQPTHAHTDTHSSISCITASLGLQWPGRALLPSTKSCPSSERTSPTICLRKCQANCQLNIFQLKPPWWRGEKESRTASEAAVNVFEGSPFEKKSRKSHVKTSPPIDFTASCKERFESTFINGMNEISGNQRGVFSLLHTYIRECANRD